MQESKSTTISGRIEPTGSATDLHAVLSARDLTYRTPTGALLVTGISMAVTPGQIVALAGPNGAGKTTLLKLLAGLLPPTGGTLHLFGQESNRLTALDRARRTAFVSQRDEPDTRLSVAQYVALGRIPHDWRCSAAEHEHAVVEALRATGMVHKAGARMGTLSGGEAQRAAIARALCQHPDILFLDEPTNHLDPKAKGELLSLIASLGTTVICVLHDLTLIPALADQVLLLDKATAAAYGPPTDALSAEQVWAVFGTEFHSLPHPSEHRSLPVLDIPITRS